MREEGRNNCTGKRERSKEGRNGGGSVTEVANSLRRRERERGRREMKRERERERAGMESERKRGNREYEKEDREGWAIEGE